MIKLEYLEKKDFKKIVEWNKNKSSDYLLQWAGPMYKHPLTEEQIEGFFLREVEKDNSNVFVYKIILVETDEMIGTIELRETDKDNRVGRICRFLIGEENIRGRGIGKLALVKALRIGFEKLKFEKIELGVFDFNHSAIKCYENVGFEKEKFLENMRKAENGYWNLYEMGISREKWGKEYMNSLNIKVPTVEEAKRMLEEASQLNPGPWVEHSLYAGEAAARIAEKCDGLDSETAKVLGMLHDLGRRAGIFSMRHSIDGYNFAVEKGYSTVGRICITHSFPYKDIRAIFGKWDCSKEEYDFVENYLESIEFNDYDKLIQLCDALALPTGFTLIEKRMIDVALRHGVNEFIVPKWKAIFEIQKYFEEKIGGSIYEVLPGVVENTFGL